MCGILILFYCYTFFLVPFYFVTCDAVLFNRASRSIYGRGSCNLFEAGPMVEEAL